MNENAASDKEWVLVMQQIQRTVGRELQETSTLHICHSPPPIPISNTASPTPKPRSERPRLDRNPTLAPRHPNIAPRITSTRPKFPLHLPNSEDSTARRVSRAPYISPSKPTHSLYPIPSYLQCPDATSELWPIDPSIALQVRAGALPSGRLTVCHIICLTMDPSIDRSFLLRSCAKR